MPASAAHRHKETNLHRFKTFSERLALVNIDAVHKIKRVEIDEDDENHSRFCESLLKWRDLDLSVQFVKFRKETIEMSKNYKMVIHYQKDIIELLQRHLVVENTLALQALLELTVALSFDLGLDFYPHFLKFFNILTGLLNVRDADKLEWIFTSISMLFRNLWRYMLDDMQNILDMYAHLLTGEHPEHIGSFAAESISFLLRKSKDHKLVLHKLFKILSGNPQGVNSIGRVLFYLVKSSQNQFHSSTEKVIPVVLSSLAVKDEGEFSRVLVFDAVNVSFHLMAEHTKRKYALPIWNILLSFVEEQLKGCDVDYLVFMLKLLNTWCLNRQCSKLVDIDQVVHVISKTVVIIEKDMGKNLDLHSVLCEFSTTLLTGLKAEMLETTKHEIMCKLSKSSLNFDSMVKFWESLYEVDDINDIIQKPFLQFCHLRLQKKFDVPQVKVVQLLVDYSMYSFDLPVDAEEVSSFLPKQIDFSMFPQKRTDTKISEVVLSLLKSSSDSCTLWYAAAILQHITAIRFDVNSILTELIAKLLKSVFNNENEAKDFTESFAVIAMCVQVLVIRKKTYGLSSIKFLPLMEEFSSDKHVLFLFDMLLQNNLIEREKLSKFEESLEKYVSSSCPKTRALSLRLLIQICSNSDVYSLCNAAERTLPTGLNFRARLLALSKLQKHDDAESRELSSLERRVVIRFLFSNLYINLTPIWKPVQDFVSTHAPLVKTDDFWVIVLELLEEATENAETAKWWLPVRGHKAATPKSDSNLYELYLAGERVNKQKVVNPRPDFFNYRLLLWKTLSILPHPGVIEGYNKKLTHLLFRYMENEHYVIDRRASPVQDLAEFQENVEERPTRKKDAVKILCTIFGVFRRFSDPSGSYQPERRKDLFLNMLTHSDPQMQEASLKCIMTYKNKDLAKHSEDLFNFFDDKIFRDTMTKFVIADLPDDERKNVVPILVRILFGRMKSKTGLATSGKGASTVRQAVVVRYLSNVNESEMQCFVNMVLEPFHVYLNFSLDIGEAVSAVIEKHLTSFKVVPLSRQQGILSTIQTLIKKHKGKLPMESYSSLLKLLLCLISSYSSLLKSQTENNLLSIDKHFLPALRNLRKLCTEIFINLLNCWPAEMALSNSQISVMFSTLIWPGIENLAHESAGQPTVLLKLIECFTQHVKYLPYLVKLNTSEQDNVNFSTVMDALVFILNSPKTSSDICNFILDMTINLTIPIDKKEEEDETVKNLQDYVTSVGSVSEVFEEQDFATKFSFGIAIVNPRVKPIINYFVNQLMRSKRGLSFNPKQLELLALLSKNVDDEKLLSDVSELLLSHVLVVSSKPSKKHGKSVNSALKTLSHTMQETRFLPKLCRLFSTVSDRESRLSLVAILKQISRNSDRLLWTAGIVERLNAWDKRYIEEMDFDSRLTAFQDVAAVLLGENYGDLFAEDCLSFLPIMHCCVHTILTCYSDISLRESVSRVLNVVIDRVMDMMNCNFDEGALVYKKVVKEMLLPLVERGLKSGDEGCRHETIRIMSKLVRVFVNEPMLEGLFSLCNLTNPDDDFFENVCHIQIHRRSRAFRKIARILNPNLEQNDNSNVTLTADDENNNKMQVDSEENASGAATESPIPCKIATKYLLPIAMQTLHTYTFTKELHLKQACLSLVRSCASMMSWSSYKRFLLLHMWSLDRHKTSIDVVCAALTVFPFNLTFFKSSELFEIKNIVVNFPEVESDEYKLKPENNEEEEDKNIEEENSENEKDDEKMEEEAQHPDQNPTVTDLEAKAIVTDVIKLILPKLRDILSRKDEGEEHKLSSAKTDIELCKGRIPLAIAMVSALRKLPADIVRSQLSSVILKVVGYLRHKLHDVRIIAGEAMVDIVKQLGPSFLFVLVKDMKSGLCRGYQKHVLVHVLNSMLTALIPSAGIGDFDNCMSLLLEIMNDDLFGQTADEKGVEKLKAKIPEARSRSKAFTSYKTLARFIGMQSFTLFLDPLKQQLDQTHKIVVKKTVKVVLTEINHGLMENEGLTAINILTLVHGLLGRSVLDLFPTIAKSEDKTMEKPGLKPPSCLLLPNEPKRYGSKPTAKTVKTNMHLFVEFALQLLHFAFKKQIVTLSTQEHLELLDPFVERLFQCLKSTHQQTIVDTTRCLTRMLRGDMPSLHAHIAEITAVLFKILRSHTKGAGNQETAAVTFKSLSVLCSTDYGHCLTESQLKVLLTYAEEDLYDSQRQTHAFDLIKSILKRGLKCPEVSEVIDKVKKLAIQSHAPSSRAQSRSLYLYFLMNHPLAERKIQQHLEFVLAQLSYEFEDGRSSSFELLSMIITSFPGKFVAANSTFIFVPTAAALVNDESQKCRKMAAATIKLLLQRLNSNERKELFDLVIQWYSAKVPAQQKLASILVSLFAEIETTDLQKHFKNVLPTIEKCISDEIKQDDIDETIKAKDHSLYHHLSAFLAILKFCDISRLPKYQALLCPIFLLVESLLTHPHNWVRLACAQIYGCLFGAWDAQDLAQHSGCELYFSNNIDEKLCSLSDSFCEQLKSGLLMDQLAEQVIKNLLFVARVLDFSDSKQRSESNQVHPGIINLLKQLQYVNKHEQAYDPKVTTKRTAVLKFCAAACLNIHSPERFLKLILEPVHRGINASATFGAVEQESISKLRLLASEVLDLIKTRMDADVFSQAYFAVSKKLSHKRRERKTEKALQLVADPQKAATLKIKKQVKTKLQRKRKIANRRPEYGLANLEKLRKHN